MAGPAVLMAAQPPFPYAPTLLPSLPAQGALMAAQPPFAVAAPTLLLPPSLPAQAVPVFGDLKPLFVRWLSDDGSAGWAASSPRARPVQPGTGSHASLLSSLVRLQQAALSIGLAGNVSMELVSSHMGWALQRESVARVLERARMASTGSARMYQLIACVIKLSLFLTTARGCYRDAALQDWLQTQANRVRGMRARVHVCGGLVHGHIIGESRAQGFHEASQGPQVSFRSRREFVDGGNGADSVALRSRTVCCAQEFRALGVHINSELESRIVRHAQSPDLTFSVQDAWRFQTCVRTCGVCVVCADARALVDACSWGSWSSTCPCAREPCSPWT